MKILKIVLGLFLISLLFLVGCRREETYRYSDFDHIDHWDDLDRLQGNKTIIYYYDPFCDICIALEEPVTSLLKQLEGHVEIFLIDDGKIYEQGEPSFETFGVPSLIIFYNQEFYEWISGSNPTLRYLENEIESLSK